MSTPSSAKETSHKSSTAARLAITSGPAAATAEARKNKKKKHCTPPHHPPHVIAPLISSLAPLDSQQVNQEIMVILPPTSKDNVISVPIPADAIRHDPASATSTAAFHPAQPSPSPSPIPAPPDDMSPSPPLTPTQRQTPARPSEAPTEDLTLLLAQDVSMFNDSPPSPDPITEPTANLFTQFSQPCRPLAISRSEGNISNAGLQPNPSSIRMRVEENAALRSQDPNGTPRSALDKYTKANMPMVHDAFPTALYENIDFQLLDTWEKCPGEKLLIQPFDKVADTIKYHGDVRSSIMSAINEITQAVNFSVSVPLPNGKQTPTTFLAYNLSQDHQKILLERYVWASSAITFRVMPTDPPCPNFMFTIKDLGTMVNDDVRVIVQNVWKDNETNAFLSNIVNSVPLTKRRSLATAIQNFIDSLSIIRLDTKRRGSALRPHFNVFAKGTLIGDDKTWTQIRSFLANRTYADKLLGFGTTKITPFHCTICHGVDHPRGLCPFPTIEGWNGPLHQSTNRNDRDRL